MPETNVRPRLSAELPIYMRVRREVGAFFLKAQNRRYAASSVAVHAVVGFRRWDQLTVLSFREPANPDGSFWVHAYGVCGAEALVSNPEYLLDDSYCQALWNYFNSKTSALTSVRGTGPLRHSHLFAFYERLLVWRDGSVDLERSELGAENAGWGFLE